jgi:hypothetical protein
LAHLAHKKKYAAHLAQKQAHLAQKKKHFTLKIDEIYVYEKPYCNT